MPRKPVDYSKTVIYKLVCNDLEITDIYVGSTSNFRTRKDNHKSKCSNEKCKAYKLKVYQTIRENGGFDNYSMLEIEKFPCKDKNEARARERHWYEELKAKLNSQSPTLNVEKQKEKQKEKSKKYHVENREERTQKMREYHVENREKINGNKKIYDDEHREERSIKARVRYAKKKVEKIFI